MELTSGPPAHTSYLSFFLHRQNFWRIKFTPKNANFSRYICKKTPKKEEIEKEENVKDCKNADWLDLLSLRRSLVQT